MEIFAISGKFYIFPSENRVQSKGLDFVIAVLKEGV